MENLVTAIDWRGKRVFLTGDTGFKGSWLALWLTDLGAEVTGFALPPQTTPSLFDQAQIGTVIRHIDGDIRDLAALESAMAVAQPDVVFHLAAQALVRYSYDHPVETYATNVMGTVHLLDACRRMPSVRAIVAITSDKCYDNREWVWPYRESDPLGGHDPYSSSKGAAEIVIAAYRSSFLHSGVGLASVRAGNVIGGGDWAADRLIPDIIRSLETGDPLSIRSPDAIRPWQHVMEALSGYLLIAERLLAGDARAASAWNFGPSDADARPVGWIVDHLLGLWGAEGAGGWQRPEGAQPHEAHLLRLDCSKARAELGWHPQLNLAEALRHVVDWHKRVGSGGDARLAILDQLRAYRRAGAAAKIMRETTR